MRIHCWGWPSHDSLPEDLKAHSLTFVDDTEKGEILICGYCGEEFELLENMEACPKCNNNLVFPRADW